jgi:hypothetical protein
LGEVNQRRHRVPDEPQTRVAPRISGLLGRLVRDAKLPIHRTDPIGRGDRCERSWCEIRSIMATEASGWGGQSVRSMEPLHSVPVTARFGRDDGSVRSGRPVVTVAVIDRFGARGTGREPIRLGAPAREEVEKSSGLNMTRISCLAPSPEWVASSTSPERINEALPRGRRRLPDPGPSGRSILPAAAMLFFAGW